MATIAANPEWYDRSGNVVPRMDITEVAVVSNYAPTGNEVASWDASAAQDGSAWAYIEGTKLILVCDSLTVIPDKMFFKFISLAKISGLQSVTTIGRWAFCATPVLNTIDIAPEKLTSIGNDAFRLSGIEDTWDLSGVSLDVIGDRATRGKRWSEDGLTAIRSVAFPADTIYLQVPNADCQAKYADVPYATVNGEVKTVADAACRTFGCYHAWNALYAGTDKEYPDFLTWFNDKLNTDGKYAENTELSEANRKRDYALLGWQQTSSEYIAVPEQLEYIINELTNGFPVYVSMRAGNETGYHTVVCVGCDSETHKLAIVDSDIRKDKGVVYWAAYEDLFSEGTADTSEVIRKLDYNQPVLAASDSWFTQGAAGIEKSSVTEIEIVTSYAPTGDETASWDASAKKNGSVMVYVTGTKLIIAGNGDNYVYANPDFHRAFSDASTANWFTNLVRIDGAERLNTSKVWTLDATFSGCTKLSFVDVSDWDTSNCKIMSTTFQVVASLKELDLSQWDVSNVTTMQSMFLGHSTFGLTGLVSVGDLSDWDTRNVTSMRTMFLKCPYLHSVNVGNWDVSNVTDTSGMFQDCQSLKELDFSNWDNAKVTKAPEMFTNTYNLEKITIGKNFNFSLGAALPAPSSDYIPMADGNWYDYDYNAYAPEAVMAEERTETKTYYASKFVAAGDDDELVFVRNGTLRQIAVALRSKNGASDTMYPSAFAEAVLELNLT